MKKISIIVVALLLGAFAANAQPKAIGIRGFFSQWQLSYEHYLGDPNFLEFDLGGTRYHEGNMGFDLSGLYNWTIAQPDWTPRGDWGFYLGAGAALGSWYNKEAENHMWIGLAAQAGLEYTFWFPLQLALDLRPVWGFNGYGFGFYPTFAVRYAF